MTTGTKCDEAGRKQRLKINYDIKKSKQYNKTKTKLHNTYNCDLFVFGPELAILKIPLPRIKLKKGVSLRMITRVS